MSTSSSASAWLPRHLSALAKLTLPHDEPNCTAFDFTVVLPLTNNTDVINCSYTWFNITVENLQLS